jgi:hypothetical protein
MEHINALYWQNAKMAIPLSNHYGWCDSHNQYLRKTYEQDFCTTHFKVTEKNSQIGHKNEFSVHDIKAYGTVDISLHPLLNSALGKGECSA